MNVKQFWTLMEQKLSFQNSSLQQSFNINNRQARKKNKNILINSGNSSLNILVRRRFDTNLRKIKDAIGI